MHELKFSPSLDLILPDDTQQYLPNDEHKIVSVENRYYSADWSVSCVDLWLIVYFQFFGYR